MKIILILIIVLIGYWGTKNYVPLKPLLSIFGFMAIAPIIAIVVRKYLFQSVLVYFIFVLFERLWRFRIPLIPDMPPQRIIWLIVVLFLLADLALKKRRILPGSKSIELWMFIFCIYILITGVLTGSVYVEGQGLQLVFLLKGYIMPFTIFFLAKNLIDDEQKVRKVFIFFSFIGLYLGLTGIFEHFQLNYLVFPSYIMDRTIGLHWGQARGPFVQAGVNGMTIGMIFFITLILFLNEKKRNMKIFCCISLVSLLTTLLFTFNRASWFAFVLASFVIPLFIPKMRTIFITACLVISLMLVAGYGMNQLQSNVSSGAGELKKGLDVKDAIAHRFKSKGSLYSRINIFVTSVKMISKKPVFGFGYNRFKLEAPKYFTAVEGVPFNIGKGLQSHNTFLIILAELGLVGLSIYFMLMGSIFKMSKRLYYQLPSEGFLGKNLVIVFWGVCIVYFIGMQFREMQYNIFPNGLFFLFAGILSGFYQRLQFNGVSNKEQPQCNQLDCY